MWSGDHFFLDPPSPLFCFLKSRWAKSTFQKIEIALKNRSIAKSTFQKGENTWLKS